MIHPCAACHLRFRTTGELRDHVLADHVEPPAPPTATSPHRHATLSRDAFSRSGWALPDVPTGPDPTDPGPAAG